MEGTPWTRADRDNAAMSVFRITPAILLAALAPPACGQGGSDDSQASARTGHRDALHGLAGDIIRVLHCRGSGPAQPL